MNLADAIDLLDESRCSAPCLLALRPDCSCICKEEFHGSLRAHVTALESHTPADPLVGRWFTSFVDMEDGCRLSQYNGQVVAVVSAASTALYLVEMYGLSGPHSQSLQPLEAMLGWAFYDSAEWWNGAAEEHWQAHGRHARHEEKGAA